MNKTDELKRIVAGKNTTLDALAALMGYAAWGAAIWRLADFSIQPLYVFTEWVPEVVVELSSLTERFWALHWSLSDWDLSFFAAEARAEPISSQ